MEKTPSTTVPRGLRNLSSPTTTTSRTTELQRLQADAAALDAWWKNDPRWQHTQRVYSGRCNSCQNVVWIRKVSQDDSCRFMNFYYR
jgi:hypothetical protein